MKRKPWLAKAIIKAIIAALAPVGSLIAAYLNPAFKPYILWIWIAYGIYVVLTFIYEFAASERIKPEPPPSTPTPTPPATDRSISIGSSANDSIVNSGDNSQQLLAEKFDGDMVGHDKFTTIHLHQPQSDIKLTSTHQLPPKTCDFTGRQAEIDELLEKAKNGGITICGLKGEGGVGKTALALVIAHELAGQYPDGQLYIDLMGINEQPVKPSEAMSHFIRAWHPDAKLPDDEASLRSTYLSVLHEKRALLLLDNAKDADQVMPLLPPANCLALVTSRQHFELPGCYSKCLDMLPPKDARDLILKISPRIGDKADDLAKACGYLPLALRLAASALASRADLSPAEYINRLKDAKNKLKLIDASLSLSYDLLTPDQQRIWCRLGVFPSTFDAKAAAAIWEMNADDALDILGEVLYKRSMVEIESEGRWKLHDLSRVYALSKLNGDELSNVESLHAQYYANLVRAADDLYRKGGESVLIGLALFDLERMNIEAGQSWSAKRATSGDLAAQMCVGYALGTIHTLSLRLHMTELIRWLSSALEAARHLGDSQGEGSALGNLGNAYHSLGDYNRAIKSYEQHLAIAREIGDRLGEGQSLLNLGNAYHSLGDYNRAIEFYEQRLAIAREIGDRRGEGTALGNLGNAYHSLGEYNRAIEFHEQSLAIAREMGNRQGEGIALGNLGIAYRSLGEYNRAIEFHEQHLAIAREIGDRLGEGQSLGSLGNAYDSLGDYNRAIEFHEQSLAIAREIGDRRGEGTALGNLGNAYDLLGEYNRAIEFHEQSLAIAREIGDRRGEGTVLWNMSLTMDILGNRKQAISCAKSAFEIFEQIQNPYAAKVRAKLAEWQSSPE